MQINSYNYADRNAIVRALDREIQAQRNGQNMDGIKEKVKVSWSRTATFISSLSLGAISGVAAGLAAWTFTAINPVVISAVGVVGLTLSPAVVPVAIGLGVGVGVAVIAAGLISSVAKLNTHFRINRAEQQCKNIRLSLQTHRDHFNRRPEFNYSLAGVIPQGGDILTRKNTLTQITAHLDSMSTHLEELAGQSEAVSEDLDKNQAVIQFACHEMLKNYQMKYNRIKDRLEWNTLYLKDPTSVEGINQCNELNGIRHDLIEVEAEYFLIRNKRIQFFDTQLKAQKQYVKVLKEKLS